MADHVSSGRVAGGVVAGLTALFAGSFVWLIIASLAYFLTGVTQLPPAQQWAVLVSIWAVVESGLVFGSSLLGFNLSGRRRIALLIPAALGSSWVVLWLSLLLLGIVWPHR